MSFTKRQLVEASLEELGLASYAFDLMPEQVETALRRLDAMIAEWNARGIRLGYSLPNNPEDSDIAADSALPDSSWEAVVTNLALRLAPSYGKTVSVDTRVSARHSLNTLLAKFTMPNEMQLNTLPVGAGNKSLDQPFSSTPTDPLVVGQDATLDFN